MKPTHVKIEIIAGEEGPCLALWSGDNRTRIAGPKPWGGGKTIHTFTVRISDILDALPKDE